MHLPTYTGQVPVAVTPVDPASPRILASYAVQGSDANPLAARLYPEPPHPYRGAFQRDRARIIHSRAFRRLAGKTQVFTHRPSDHFRSRLTHTMEVAQIARAIAGALHLNEDLTEALALVHDIGHPPFGHAGEQALDSCLRQHALRFDHNLHALRIVEYFEQRYAAFRGLNLTLAVREGIVKHSRDYHLSDHPELAPYLLDQRPPLEAQLIDWADEIAYLTADLDDGFESGILAPGHMREYLPLFDRHFTAIQQQYPGAPARLQLNEVLKRILNTFVDNLIQETARRINAGNMQTLADVRLSPERIVGFSPAVIGMHFVGALLAGGLATALGVRAALLILTALLAASGLAFLLTPMRQLRDLPAKPANKQGPNQ